jgi:hypothetical protein
MNDLVQDVIADFYSERAGYPLRSLQAGQTVVEASDLRCSGRSGTVLQLHALADRVMVSTPPQLRDEVEEVVLKAQDEACLLTRGVADLSALCASRLGGANALYVYEGVRLFCTQDTYVFFEDANVRQITRQDALAVIAQLRDEGIPDDVDYLLADNAAFIYLVNGRAASFAATHPVGRFSDRVGNVMVGTVGEFRRRGYDKKVVSATTKALLGQGRIALYATTADNVASLATATAVGYQEHCRVFEVRQ